MGQKKILAGLYGGTFKNAGKNYTNGDITAVWRGDILTGNKNSGLNDAYGKCLAGGATWEEVSLSSLVDDQSLKYTGWIKHLMAYEIDHSGGTGSSSTWLIVFKGASDRSEFEKWFNDVCVKGNTPGDNHITPAPSAIVLGSLGLCLVGWFQRRHMPNS